MQNSQDIVMKTDIAVVILKKRSKRNTDRNMAPLGNRNHFITSGQRFY
jgi:hypothetical protein